MHRFQWLVASIVMVAVLSVITCASSHSSASYRPTGYTNEYTRSSQSISAEDQLADVLSRTIVICAALAGDDYNLAHIEVDRLSEGASYTFTRTLYSGNDYKIVGIGGQGIEDLDIYVYNSDGELVGRDTQVDNIPIVKFHVNSTQTYRIKVKFYSAEDDWPSGKESFFSVAVGFK